MTIKSAICKGRVRTVEDAIDAWKMGHDNAIKVRDAEDLVTAYIQLVEFLTGWVKEAWDDAFAGININYQEAGWQIKKWLKATVNAGEQIKRCVLSKEGNGYALENSSNFSEAIRSAEALKTDFEERWPIFDTSDLQRARKATAMGEVLEAGDILRELQGGH